MPQRYKVRTVDPGHGAFGSAIAAGMTQGVQNFESGRARQEEQRRYEEAQRIAQQQRDEAAEQIALQRRLMGLTPMEEAMETVAPEAPQATMPAQTLHGVATGEGPAPQLATPGRVVQGSVRGAPTTERLREGYTDIGGGWAANPANRLDALIAAAEREREMEELLSQRQDIAAALAAGNDLSPEQRATMLQLGVDTTTPMTEGEIIQRAWGTADAQARGQQPYAMERIRESGNQNVRSAEASARSRADIQRETSPWTTPGTEEHAALQTGYLAGRDALDRALNQVAGRSPQEVARAIDSLVDQERIAGTIRFRHPELSERGVAFATAEALRELRTHALSTAEEIRRSAPGARSATDLLLGGGPPQDPRERR